MDALPHVKSLMDGIAQQLVSHACQIVQMDLLRQMSYVMIKI